jgi:Zn finger protein HypA/HybF involved in hydrogenase expression
MTDPDRSVAELAAEGVEAVDAFCGKCGNSWQAPISFLPPGTTVAKVEALMACPRCNSRRVEILPAISDRVRPMN